jgi:multisubunit Na+/H+ antiporter MnhC subunit
VISKPAGGTRPDPGFMLGLDPSAEPPRLSALDHPQGRCEVICLALAAAEVCWVTPLFLALNWAKNPHSPVLLWLGLLILLVGYFYFYRALVAGGLSLWLQQGLLVLGLLLSIVVVLRFHVYSALGLQGYEYLLVPFRHLTEVAVVMPSGWLTVMMLVYLWARAVHLANRSLSPQSVGFSFRSGVVVLVAFAFLIRIFTGLDVAGFVVPYFFFALLAVALSRVDEVSILPNSSRVPFTGFWVGSTVAAVAILTFLGLLLAVFFVGGGLSRSLQWLSPVFLVLQIVVAGIGAFLLMILDWIMTQMSVDLSAFGEGLRDVFARLGGLFVLAPPAPPSDAEYQTRPLILAIMQVVITVVIPASMIALVLLLTWRRLQRRRSDQGLDEARESLFTVGAVARNLKAMLQDGMGRLGPGSRFLAAVSIRRIYANLVRLATELGYPRSKAQTPYEYLIILCEALPDNEAEVELITEAYVNAHYGQVPDTREELQRIRDSWERVRAETARRQRPDGA